MKTQGRCRTAELSSNGWMSRPDFVQSFEKLSAVVFQGLEKQPLFPSKGWNSQCSRFTAVLLMGAGLWLGAALAADRISAEDLLQRQQDERAQLQAKYQRLIGNADKNSQSYMDLLNEFYRERTALEARHGVEVRALPPDPGVNAPEQKTELAVQQQRELWALQDRYEDLINQNGLRGQPKSPAYQSLMERYQRSVAMIERNYAQEGLKQPEAAPPVNSMTDHFAGRRAAMEVQVLDPWLGRESSARRTAQILAQSAEKVGILKPPAGGASDYSLGNLHTLDQYGDSGPAAFWEKVRKLRNGASLVEAGVYTPDMPPWQREEAIGNFNKQQMQALSFTGRKLESMLPPDTPAKVAFDRFRAERTPALDAVIDAKFTFNRPGQSVTAHPQPAAVVPEPVDIKVSRTAGSGDAMLAEAQRLIAENERRLQPGQGQPRHSMGSGQSAGQSSGLFDGAQLKPQYAGNEKILEALANRRPEAEILTDIKSGRMGGPPVPTAAGESSGLFDGAKLKPQYAGNEKILEALAGGRSEAQILADIKSGRLGGLPDPSGRAAAVRTAGSAEPLHSSSPAAGPKVSSAVSGPAASRSVKSPASSGVTMAPASTPDGAKVLEPMRPRSAAAVPPQKGAQELKSVEGFEHAENAGSIEAMNRLKEYRFFRRTPDGKLIELNTVDMIDAPAGRRGMILQVHRQSGAMVPLQIGEGYTPAEKQAVLGRIRAAQPWLELPPKPTSLTSGQTPAPGAPTRTAAALEPATKPSGPRPVGSRGTGSPDFLPVPVKPETTALVPYQPPETALSPYKPPQTALVPAQPASTALVPAQPPESTSRLTQLREPAKPFEGSSTFWPQDENGPRMGDQRATWAEATRAADVKIKNFENAVKYNLPTRAQAALELQADPLAVQRLNQNSPPELKLAHNAATDAVKNGIREQIKADVARKYGVTPDRVLVEDMTKPPNPNGPKVGQDWDFTTKVQDQSGRTLEVPVKDIRPIVDNAVKANPAVRSLKPLQPGGNLTEHLAITPTDHLHPEAFDNNPLTGQQLARGEVPGKFMDPAQVSKAMEHKSNLAFNKAEEFKLGGRATVQSEPWDMEAMRQGSKMSKITDTYLEQQGQGLPSDPKVPQFIRQGNNILDEVNKGTLSPAEARARFHAMGETPESFIRKSSGLVEGADVLKPPASRGPPPATEPFTQNVLDRMATKKLAQAARSAEAASGAAAQEQVAIPERIKKLPSNVTMNEFGYREPGKPLQLWTPEEQAYLENDFKAQLRQTAPGEPARPLRAMAEPPGQPAASLLDGGKSGFAPEESSVFTRGVNRAGGAVTTARASLNNMERDANVAGEQLFNAMGGGSLPAKASGARQALNAAGGRVLNAAGTVAGAYMVYESGKDVYGIGKNIYQAMDQNTTDAEANKKFDEADQLARKMALGGALGTTMAAVPLVGQAAGVGLGSYAGTRYLLENTKAGQALDGAVLDGMDATLQAGEKYSAALQGAPSQTQRDAAQTRNIQQAYQAALERGDVLLKPGVTGQQLMDDIVRSPDARGRRALVAGYAPADRQADKDFLDNLTKQLPAGGSGSRVLQNLAIDLQYGTDEQKLAARATLADIRSKVDEGDYDVAGMVRKQPATPHEPDPYGDAAHTLNSLYTDASPKEKDQIEALFVKLSRGGPDAIKDDVAALQQNIASHANPSGGAAAPDALQSTETQRKKLAGEIAGVLISQALGLTDEQARKDGALMEPPPDPDADKKRELQSYLDNMSTRGDDTRQKMDDLQKQIAQSHNSTEKKDLREQLAALQQTQSDYERRASETRDELIQLGANTGPPPPKLSYDDNGQPVTADGYTANQLDNNNDQLQNRAGGLGNDIAKLQAQIFASRNTPEKKDLMDQLQTKLQQLNSLQADVDDNNKLLHALGQGGGAPVYSRLPTSTLAGMEPDAGHGLNLKVPQVSVLAGVMGNLDADRAERTTTALANLNLQDRDVKANWVSYEAFNQIKNLLEAAGYEGRLTRGQAAQLLAQAQQANSWGSTIGNALVDSVTQGGTAFGQTLGGAGANAVNSRIKNAVTGGPRTAGGTGNNGGAGGSESRNDGGGGTTSSGDGRGSGGGDTSGDGEHQGGGGGGGSSTGDGGVVTTRNNADGTITVVYSCGYRWTGKPPAPAKCPRCNQGTPTSSTVNSGGSGGGTGQGGSGGGSGGGGNPSVISSRTNPDGTVTVVYSCGYKWTGKPPAPAKCPRCNQGTPTSTTVNSAGTGGVKPAAQNTAPLTQTGASAGGGGAGGGQVLQRSGAAGSQSAGGIAGVQRTYPDGRVTYNYYPCHHTWTGKPPAPTKCPSCAR